MDAGTRFTKYNFSWLLELDLQPRTGLFATVHKMNRRALEVMVSNLDHAMF